jgi:CBS domain-containing protein
LSLAPIQPYPGSYLMPSIEHATVSDAMHPGILSCDGDATAMEVARMMATHHVHCVAVMGLEQEALSADHRREPRIWGIISDLDLIGAAVSAGPEQTAAGLARHSVISVEPSTPIPAAAQLMLTHRAGHLVVVDPGTQRPTGILSTLDIAGILAWGEG